MNRAPAPVDRTGRLTDSPWLWVALFGFMALVALLAIQGKFSQRQARLEQRYEDRLLAQQARRQKAAAPPRNDVPIERGYDEEDAELPVAASMVEARAKASLVPLVAVAGLVTLIGLTGLLLSRNRQRHTETQDNP